MEPRTHREISPDRLTEIPADELSYLAEQFHVLTKQMYEELVHPSDCRAHHPAGRALAAPEQRRHIMTTQLLTWESRCADCRRMLPADHTGRQVHDRLLCAECAAEADWMAAAL